MELKYIEKSRKKEWEDLTKSNPASGFMQSFFWAEFLNSIGWQTYKIGIFEKNVLIGGAIIAKYMHLTNKNFLSISEGPVLPYDKPQAEKMFHLLVSEIDKIADFTGVNRTSHISVQPKLEKLPPFFSRFQKAPSDQQPIKTLIINLSLSEKELLEQMKPKGRYNIKVAQKNNVTVNCVSVKEGLTDFLKLYLDFVKRQNITGKDKTYFESFATLLPDSHMARFYFAKFEGKIISTALVFYYGNTATFLFGASSGKNKETMPGYLLHWEIIKDAKKRGFTFYDFYSLAPNDDVSHPWHGYSIFKRKFGGKEVDYLGAYDFIYNQKLYKKYVRER